MKIIQAMASFESTIDNPLGFFISYLAKDGESYLRKQFKKANNPDYYYDQQRDMIFVQQILPKGDVRGEVLDEETNCREFGLSFEDFVAEEFKTQLRITVDFIYDVSKARSDDLKLDAYKQILIEGLEIKKKIDSRANLNFRFYLNRSVAYILKYSQHKFDRYHPGLKQKKEVDAYDKSQKEKNVTGFKRKTSSNSVPLTVIFHRMRDEQFFHGSSKFKAFQQFMKGEHPRQRLDWNKELHELWYFIDQIAVSDVLENPPGQRWKHMDLIFTHQGNELPENWQRNHNKLQSQAKKEAIDRIIRMFQPRQE